MNLASICSNSNHINGIDRIKFHIQMFRSRYLQQYLTKIYDPSCSVTYVVRSTRRLSRFHELEDSNSYLYEATEVESSSSSLQWWKQVTYDEVEDEWRQRFSLTMLQLREIFNCHGSELASTAVIFESSPRFSLKQIFNSTYWWWLSQEKPKRIMKFEGNVEKKFEEFWENLWNFVIWSENVIVDYHFLLWLCLYTMY